MGKYSSIVAFLATLDLLSPIEAHQLPLGLKSDAIGSIGPSPIPKILTNILGTNSTRPEIRILDARGGEIMWTWNSEVDLHFTGGIPNSLRKCITENDSATDAKQSLSGDLIAAIYGNSIIVVQHLPETSSSDKRVVWAVCADSGLLAQSHALEFLPDGLLATATSGQSQKDGLLIFNISTGLQVQPKPVQTISGYPDIHALVWEPATSLLWAAGANASIDDAATSSGLIRGYQYQHPGTHASPLHTTPVYEWIMPHPTQIFTEWSGNGTYEAEWDGPHDLISVPGQDAFLVPTDTELYYLNRTTGEFRVGSSVAKTYLPSFRPVGNRSGVNRQGHPEELLRSDLKSISFGIDGAVIYVQPRWRAFFGNFINILDKKGWRYVRSRGKIYRARWLRHT